MEKWAGDLEFGMSEVSGSFKTIGTELFRFRRNTGRSDRTRMALTQQMTQFYMKMSKLIIKRAQFVSDRISHPSWVSKCYQ